MTGIGARLAAALLLVACAGRPGGGAGAAASATPLAERLVVDVREPRAFAAGHTAGALNLQLTWRQLPERLPAYVPDRATPLAIQAADLEEWEAASAVLHRLGYGDFVPAGPPGAERLELIDAATLRERLAGPDPPVVLDVRTPEEWSGGVVDGAVRVLAGDAPSVVPGLDPGRAYAVICEGGVRSSQLASLLRREGFARVSNVIDGMAAWRRLGPPARR